jgi:hypothetical protein
VLHWAKAYWLLACPSSHGLADPWAGSPLLHLAQLGNMAQPPPASRPMAKAGEALPWRAGGRGQSIPVRASDEVARNRF